MVVKGMTAAAFALALSACGGLPPRIALDAAAAQKLQEVKVASVLGQDEIVVRAVSAGSAGGGLLGAVIASKIDESRQNTIQALIAPFYASVDDYDFRPRLNQALGAALGDGSPLKFGAVEQVPVMSYAEMNSRQKALTGQQGLMDIRTSYTFSTDYRNLLVTTRASMAVAGAEQPAYLNTFTYISAPVGGGGSDSLGGWTENKGGRYRDAINEAAQQVAAMLKLDLAAGATVPAGLSTANLPNVPGLYLDMKPAPVLVAQQGRVIVRNAVGQLYSIAQ